MQHPRSKAGARDSSDADELLPSNASVSTKSRASIQAQVTLNRLARHRRRAHFARQATIDAFEWRYAKTLDQANFVDHPPRKTVRLPGVIVLDGGSP